MQQKAHSTDATTDAKDEVQQVQFSRILCEIGSTARSRTSLLLRGYITEAAMTLQLREWLPGFPAMRLDL